LSLAYAGVAGFALSLGLILAIGPQNVFVLRQGLLRSHVFAVCLTCSVCDALFIVAGVAGVGAALQAASWLERPLALGAAAFIAGYGILRFRSSTRPSALTVDEEETASLWPTLVAALGFTFLNPHVYLDTLLLIGGASTKFTGPSLMAFTGGAMAASFVFFFSLGFGARRFSPWLSSPKAWQRIDLGIGASMVAIGLAVAWPYLTV
jgi:L-lysine exporter family protein LysE/ArgO